MTADPNTLTIRDARADDAAALDELAALDSSRVPDGRLLVAEVAGELQAAVPVAGGRAIADPFRPTEALVGFMQRRAGRIRAVTRRREADRRRRRRHARVGGATDWAATGWPSPLGPW